MLQKIVTIKNPLTIIAIFAGLVEISATGVLPLIDVSIQKIYIWFLMIFPSSLVLLFFYTLNFNNTVLYAPSDFKEDESFLASNRKNTIKNVEVTEDEESQNGFSV